MRKGHWLKFESAWSSPIPSPSKLWYRQVRYLQSIQLSFMSIRGVLLPSPAFGLARILFAVFLFGIVHAAPIGPGVHLRTHSQTESLAMAQANAKLLVTELVSISSTCNVVQKKKVVETMQDVYTIAKEAEGMGKEDVA